jgi:hypothetical protein
MRYAGQHFAKQTMRLDGNQFINCTFDECTLLFAGTDSFEITPMDANGVTICFEGAAAAGKQLYQRLQGIFAAEAGYMELGGVLFARAEKPNVPE